MMANEAGVRPRVIHADGGATASRFLMQFVADTAGLEVRASDAADCSALGGALAGMLGLGLYRSTEELAALPRPGVSYHPAADPAVVATNCRGWERAVRGVLAAVETESEVSPRTGGLT
jgi:glycerol kinase